MASNSRKMAGEADRAEVQVREELAAAFRLVAHYGWDDLIFTHISARVPGPEHHFLINPYDLMFDEITASSLVKIDLDGNPVEPTDYTVNPAGFTIHSAIHMSREDAAAVVHLHSPFGQAVSVMECGLLPSTQIAMAVTHDLALHEHEGMATDLDERERLVADLGHKHFMLLRNHGTLAIGETVGRAFLRMYMFERACQAQVNFLAAGEEGLHRPDPSAIETVARQTAPSNYPEIERLAWPALLRKVERLYPDYNR